MQRPACRQGWKHRPRLRPVRDSSIDRCREVRAQPGSRFFVLTPGVEVGKLTVGDLVENLRNQCAHVTITPGSLRGSHLWAITHRCHPRAIYEWPTVGLACCVSSSTTEDGTLRRLWRRLGSSDEQIEAAELQESSRTAGATAIDNCNRGDVVTVAGPLRSVTLKLSESLPSG